MKKFIALLFVLFMFSAVHNAQESEAVVVDEVIAQVNEGVVTLSRLKREMKQAIEALVQEGKTPEQAKQEVENRKGELIANIINDELFAQKAKELGLDSEIDAQINQRLLQIMKEQNIRSLETLRQEMKKVGIDMDELRQAWRKQLCRDYVLQREVDSKLYWGFTARELKEYYEKNKQKFTRPETVTLSEIFLSFAGKNEAAVKEKAKQLVARIRAGEDFVKLAIENSDRPNVKETKGKLQTYRIDELDEKFAKPIRATKTGDVTDPIVLDEGVLILRVDERTAATKESYFDEDEVRRALLSEKAPDERKKYLANLRKDSYIKISESYRPLVAPILFEDERRSKN